MPNVFSRIAAAYAICGPLITAPNKANGQVWGNPYLPVFDSSIRPSAYPGLSQDEGSGYDAKGP